MGAAIVGGEGASIKLVSGGCVVTIPRQTVSGSTTKLLDNSGLTGGEFKVKFEAFSFTSKNCIFLPAEGKNGKYEGSGVETGLIAR